MPEPHNARRSNWGGSFDQLTDGSKTFYHDAVNSVWQHKQVDRSGQEHVTDRVAVNVRSNDQHLLHCAREETVENGRTRQEHNRRRRSEADWRRDRPLLSHRRRTVRRPLRMHRQTVSALRVAKSLNSNTQDVTQDGVHAEVRQGTG